MESNRWLVIAFLAGGLLIGAAAYSVGLSQGATHAAAVAGGNADAIDASWGVYHRHGWWGFPFGPILAIFFWVWLVRAMFWGFRGPWGWRRRWRYYDDYDGGPRGWDEWHRQAHQRMADEKSKV